MTWKGVCVQEQWFQDTSSRSWSNASKTKVCMKLRLGLYCGKARQKDVEALSGQIKIPLFFADSIVEQSFGSNSSAHACMSDVFPLELLCKNVSTGFWTYFRSTYTRLDIIALKGSVKSTIKTKTDIYFKSGWTYITIKRETVEMVVMIFESFRHWLKFFTTSMSHNNCKVVGRQNSTECENSRRAM